MNRFKASKFKNTTAKLSSRESWLSDLRVSSTHFAGSGVQASCAFIAFPADPVGVLGVLPLDWCGRKDGKVPLLYCHSDVVMDFNFSPFDDYVLATCSTDQTLKVWRLPEKLEDIRASPSLVLNQEGGGLQATCFHPLADLVLAAAAGRNTTVWDVQSALALAELNGHVDNVQSITWSHKGSLLATTCKDKMLRLFDPRAMQDAVQAVECHNNNKDCKVIWLDSCDLILSSSFNQVREREVKLWDNRKLTSSVHTHTVDCSQSCLMPFFDEDTGLLLLAAKGDYFIDCFEVTKTGAFLTQVCRCMTEEGTRGLGLLPKRAVDVMACEVMRALQLIGSAIVPISYVVPRKNVYEFHSDLFPDTLGATPATQAQDWWQNHDGQVQLVSMDPLQHGLQRHTSPVLVPEGRSHVEQHIDTKVPEPALDRTSLKEAVQELTGGGNGINAESKKTKFGAMASCHLLGPTSKFRHLQGTVLHRSSHISNLCGLNLNHAGRM
uniref:Coronin n=1 Tax=Eptatretus burgeri TaxID=7764 RepID=A0A8C4Q584_EPTBU